MNFILYTRNVRIPETCELFESETNLQFELELFRKFPEYSHTNHAYWQFCTIICPVISEYSSKWSIILSPEALVTRDLIECVSELLIQGKKGVILKVVIFENEASYKKMLFYIFDIFFHVKSPLPVCTTSSPWQRHPIYYFRINFDITRCNSLYTEIFPYYFHALSLIP